MTQTCDLKDFGLNPERGFLPHSDPTAMLPSQFKVWDQLGYELPKLMAMRQARAAIETMPTLDSTQITNAADIQRAMLVLSFLGHAYVWGDVTPADRIPATLAIPWHEIATRIGRPPVLSYESYALDNWYRRDSSQPIEIGNIALLQNFLGGVDEEWFVIVHVDIEANAGAAIKAIADGRRAVIDKDSATLTACLAQLGKSLARMYTTLDRMPELCDPYIYFHRVRPYIYGWKNHPALPNGVLYEGVKEHQGKPQFLRGETGAQSSIIPVIDAFLGVGHESDMLKAHLLEMRQYMPPKHRAFMEAVETGPSTRDFTIASLGSEPTLRDNYNEAVDWVEKFRSKHLEYAVSYIARQADTSVANSSAVGTGGTPFVSYLTKHRDETGKHRL